MVNDPHRLLDEFLRRDFESFIAKSFHTVSPAQELTRDWHLRAIAWHLEQCRLGRCRRLIITLPPRHLKSISASVAFPAFVLGHDPTKRIVCVSYAADLASKLARDCRAVMNASWYRRVFPGTILGREKNAELDFMTTRRGYRLSTSVGGVLTGRGGNMIIVDDPMKPDEAMSDVRRRSVGDWFDNTLYSRLDDKRSDVIIVIMQRLHLDDLVGHVLSKGEDWVQLNLPATAEVAERIQIGPGVFHDRRVGDLLQPKREPQAVLDALRQSLGSYNYAAQYQQTPIPIEGELIKWEWFRRYDTEPKRVGYDRVVQSWDTASKSGELNDFSVCTTWLIKGMDYYLTDIFRKRLLYPELRKEVIARARQFQASAVLIEDKASGTALAQDLRNGELGAAGRPITIEPEGDKVTRAAAQSLQIENGRVFLPREGPWLSELRKEIVQFPFGQFDDQIDSISQFLQWARRPTGGVQFVKLGGI